MKAESLAAASLSFAAAYGVDLLRMPTVHDLPLPAQTSLDRPLDLTNISLMSARQGFWSDRIEALRSIVSLSQARIAVFEAIAEPLTALSFICPQDLLESAEKEHPSFLKKALESITESLKGYISLLKSEAKVDGIVIEVDSACYARREPESFNTLVKPYLESLITEVTSDEETLVWLQLNGQRIYLEPILDLRHHLISWPHRSQGPSLDRLAKNRKTRVAGGIDEISVNQQSYQGIRRHVEEARDLPVSLLCPGSAFSAATAPSRLSALASFLQKRDRISQNSESLKSSSFAIDEP